MDMYDEDSGTRKPKSAILRPYQESLLANIFDAVAAGCRRLMVQAPTGAGKTIIAASINRKMIEDGYGTIFTVPWIGLIDQTVEKFRAEGIEDIGVIQADHPLTNPAARVQIASVQTLLDRDIPAGDLVMIDEAHRWYDFYRDWMARPQWANVPFIGLSATPWTHGLGKHYSKLIVATTITELIEQGYLSNFKAYAPSSPDLAGVRTVAGDYHEGDLARIMGDKTLVGDVVATWVKRGEGRPTIVFSVDCAHAKHLQEGFEAAGIRSAYIEASTSLAEREAIKLAFHVGEIKVVCNVGCLTTGIDWDVRCIILARPTKSEILFTQMIGRGLRPADGKTELLILDHSSNHTRLGFVTDIHHEILDDGEPKPKQESRKPPPNECSMCSYLKPPQVWKCPACGFAPPRPVPACLPGQLAEIKPSEHDEKMMRFYRELKWHAFVKGYKQGWIGFQFQKKFGRWPPSSFSALEAVQPSLATRTWLREQAYLFAMSRSAS
jgi:superfamily II DNA or RNA helicase